MVTTEHQLKCSSMCASIRHLCAKENNYPIVSEVLLVGHSEIKKSVIIAKETLSKESECETVRRSFDYGRCLLNEKRLRPMCTLWLHKSPFPCAVMLRRGTDQLKEENTCKPPTRSDAALNIKLNVQR